MFAAIAKAFIVIKSTVFGPGRNTDADFSLVICPSKSLRLNAVHDGVACFPILHFPDFVGFCDVHKPLNKGLVAPFDPRVAMNQTDKLSLKLIHNIYRWRCFAMSSCFFACNMLIIIA